MQSPTLKHDILTVLRGARNGFYYGAKIRCMHSLVMLILFAKGPLSTKLRRLVENTLQHGSKLAVFVTLYKSSLILLRRLSGRQFKWHYFLAGCVCGYYVFRKNTPIDQQLVFYLMSRNIVGGAQNLVERGVLPDWQAFPVLALLCWGTVMFLFGDNSRTLQPSLRHSMNFLYLESDSWNDWTDFVPFYIPREVVGWINSRLAN